MSRTTALIGTIIFWAAIVLAVFGFISAAMSLAMFEGDERYTGAGRWAAFAVVAYVIGRLARRFLVR